MDLPLGIPDENNSEKRLDIPQEINLLPLRDSVIFPLLISPLTVSRESSMKLIDDSVIGGNRIIGVVAQRDPTLEKPKFSDVYSIGVAVVIKMLGRMPDGIRLLVQGISRIRILEPVQEEPFLRAKIEVIEEPMEISDKENLEVEALKRSISDLFEKAISLSGDLPDDLRSLTSSVTEPWVLADLVAAHLRVAPNVKQLVLESLELIPRMKTLLQVIGREVQVLELGSKLQTEVSAELSKTQREYYLREQIKAIHRELGDSEDRALEIDELRQKLIDTNMPEEALKEASRELDRLSRMSPGSPEYTVARTYVDWMIALPWQLSTEDNLDIVNVKKVMDDDHSGLDKVKERIIEFLAVRKFKTNGTVRQPILCFVGPPGVGKTSLSKSIARAMDRKFVRLSLGGMRDEAEIRGHRRTYIGALPGQIIQSVRRAGSNNPVIGLDEVDKVGQDWRGDPSSALLEVLDPEQNFSFRDHYLDVAFDLSKVFFITTANVLDTIPMPLRDRMEIIEISGYTAVEKLHIAKKHLIPKQMEEHGLTSKNIRFSDDSLRFIIHRYTREAGVRNLERNIAGVCRKITRKFAEGENKRYIISQKLVEDLLDLPPFPEDEAVERQMAPGVAVGLAWTPFGGDVMFIESSRMSGSKQLILTGQLGDVMKESATTALSYLRANAAHFGIDPDFYEKHDLHIHVPEGAIPKDGPSAGVTMATALASLLTNRPVRTRLAMTGEITLSGQVLPVGGIKEKVLAAHRAGINHMIVPKRNEKQVLEDIPEEIRKAMKFEYVEKIDTVIKLALDKKRPSPHR